MSGTVIVTKYSTGTGSPATNALAVGEQAYSFSSDKMFIGETSGSDVVARVIGGQLYTDMMDHAAGTLMVMLLHQQIVMVISLLHQTDLVMLY